MEEKNKTGGKVAIIILIVLLVAALVYTFYKSGEHKKLTNAIVEEKEEIEGNLDNMIVRYEEAIGQNTSMSQELEFERDRIIALRDSIKGVSASNYSLIRKYRKQIANLEETNRRLFFMTDSLTNVNELLGIDLDSARVHISKQIAINDTLSMQNVGLSEKVALGSILRVNTAKVIAMRERNSGKLTETSRARNTDAFRVNFTIEKNEIAEKGDRQIHIQIVDLAGKVIGKTGSLTTEEGIQIGYSDTTMINYLNEPIDVISLVEVNRDGINKGVYGVNIFVENKIIGATKITLK